MKSKMLAMKYFIFSFGALFLFASCNSQQTEAKKLAGQIQSAVTPGTIPTKDGGWTMKAKIKDENWVAVSMMPATVAGRIIGYFNNEYISLPYNRRYLYVGNKIKFSESNAVDLAVNDDIGLYGGRKGEMEITKVDDNWAEGKFYFTGSTVRGSTKTVEVTDGFFRISLARKP